MIIRYLGTGAAEGCPGVFCRCPACETARKLGGHNLRTRSQALVDDSILVDFPADSYLHMRDHQLDLSGIGHLLITHSHGDHFYPIDLFLRQPPYTYTLRDRVLNLYGSAGVERVFLEMAGRFAQPRDIMHYIRFQRVCAFEPFDADGYTITPLPTDHMDTEDAFIYMIEKDGTRLLYGNDSGFFLQSVWDALEGKRFGCVSLDCTMVFQGGYRCHMGFDANQEIRLRMLENGMADANTRFVAVHFSHGGFIPSKELEPRAKALGFSAAYDGMRLAFS